MNTLEEFFKKRISFTSTICYNTQRETGIIYRSKNTFEANMYNFDLYKKVIPFFYYVESDLKNGVDMFSIEICLFFPDDLGVTEYIVGLHHTRNMGTNGFANYLISVLGMEIGRLDDQTYYLTPAEPFKVQFQPR